MADRAGSPQARKTLSEACAPVFLYLATFRRNAETSRLSIAELQSALKHELEGVQEECRPDHRLYPLFERVWYALVATADQVVLSSTWQQRNGWSLNLLERHYFKTLEGGKRFYKLVDEVLSDPTDAGAEVAECLFHCMGLGFQGELLGERKELERRRRQLFEKARLAGALGDYITPDAYGRNSALKAVTLPTANMLRLVAVAIGAILFALLLGKFSTRWTNNKSLKQIGVMQDKLAQEPNAK